MDAPPSNARVVLVTAPDEECARSLAEELVDAGLAACATLIPRATSVYRWRGRVQAEAEVLMLLKTTAERLAALEARVAKLHPYEVPEFVALAPTHVEAHYLAWLGRCVDPDADDDPADESGATSEEADGSHAS